MRRSRAILFATAVLAAVTVAPGLPCAAEYTIKLAHVAQPNTPLDQAMQLFAQEVAAKSNHRIEIQDFHSSQLGGERDYVEGMQLGSLEMAATSTGVLGTFEKSTDILALPFLFRSSEHLDHVLDGPIGQKLAAKFEPIGIHVLGWLDLGARYIFNARRPIRTPADMKGLKFRVIENPIFVDTYQALGSRAVPMARPEVYSALKEGVLDGLDNGWSFYHSMGDYEVAKYATMGVQLFQTPGALMVSESYFKKLPPDLQKVLVEAAADVVPKERQLFRAADQKTAEELKTKGVIEVEGDRAPFEKAAKVVWDKFSNQVGGREMIDAVLNTK